MSTKEDSTRVTFTLSGEIVKLFKIQAIKVGDTPSNIIMRLIVGYLNEANDGQTEE